MAELTYTRTNWKDFPEKTTPVNATNLNNIENGIEINKANIDKLSAKVVEKAKDFQGSEIIIAADQGTVQGSGVELSDLATQQDIDELSTNGIRFEQGDFRVGRDNLDDEFLYAPTGSNLIVESSNDKILASINEGGYLQLSYVLYPTADNDAATKIYVDNKLSSKQDVLTTGNNGIVLAGSTISLNTNFIFETLLEYADVSGTDINLSEWINPTSAASYRYFVVDLFIEPDNFSPQHLPSFWISADAVTWGLKTSMVYNLVGYDNLYMENVSVIFHDQVWLSLRNTPATSGTSSGARNGSVYRIQGVR